MKLKLERKYLKDDYTIGNLYLDYGDGKGWQFFCNTLEDKIRDTNKDGDLNDPGETKIYGRTAIPYGTYEFILTHSPKFGIVTPLLLEVPEFSYIRIHAGSTASNSEGCILVGENKVKGMVVNSKITFNKLMEILNKFKQRKYTIEIV